jgi:membrane-associated phospholipid phosphatase
MIDYSYKLYITLIAFLCIAATYVCTQQLQLVAFNLSTDIDRAIPFIPAFAWPYVSLFPAILITHVILIKRKHVFIIAMLTCVIVMLFSTALFLMLPSACMIRLELNYDDDMYTIKLLKLTYSLDMPTNAFPSMHVAYATCMCSILSISVHAKNILLRIFHALWMLMIIASTLFIKQHNIVDVLSGLIVGYASFRLAVVIYYAKKLRRHSL